MSNLPTETDTFVAELDAAVEAHMNWTRRILRCAVLRLTPGEDVLDPWRTPCAVSAPGSWKTGTSSWRWMHLPPTASKRCTTDHA
ncbi:hypothetical protein [Thiobacillus denitrificans]|uniref:Uncharacterized protein n=1 Tax=Thiobacillus denitrificans TaxID=36861 RepID=A0A119CW40_THIDE|nr:hypothetical protein [Thiobacillus denitrificans]KVW96047.1 hypothetical protein ABW22_08380 [Thiobacillus denitrificans]